MYIIFYLRVYFLFILALLALLVFTDKKVNKIWLVLLGIFPVAGIYILNPYALIFPKHGLLHTAIAYQILEGNVPPPNPFLSGQPLCYFWGYHYFAALISRVLNIIPSRSMMLINITSLGVVMVLIYRISNLLINEEKTNIFSILISIFGTTVFPVKKTGALPYPLNSLSEFRGIPVFDKICTVNGYPAGLAFFFLFLYSFIKIFQDKKVRLNLILFFISVLGCGFFYPAILPGIVISAVVICLFSIGFEKNRGDFRKIVLVVSIILVSILFLAPYLSYTGAGIIKKIQFFNLYSVSLNIVKYSIATIPILFIIYINRNFLKDKLNKQALTILLMVVLINFLIYIFVHLEETRNEYKFLILSVAALGVLGGIAFGAMRKWCNKFVVFFLLCLFVLPSYKILEWKLPGRSPYFKKFIIENGKYVYYGNEEENQLYQWIRENTPTNSSFIDTELSITVFAQRQLFIAMDKDNKLQGGYADGIEWFLKDVMGYDSGLLQKRKKIVKDIYALNQRVLDKETEEFLDSERDIYIVARKIALRDKFNQLKFAEVFRSKAGNFIVYKWKNPAKDEYTNRS